MGHLRSQSFLHGKACLVLVVTLLAGGCRRPVIQSDQSLDPYLRMPPGELARVLAGQDLDSRTLAAMAISVRGKTVRELFPTVVLELRRSLADPQARDLAGILVSTLQDIGETDAEVSKVVVEAGLQGKVSYKRVAKALPVVGAEAVSARRDRASALLTGRTNEEKCMGIVLLAAARRGDGQPVQEFARLCRDGAWQVRAEAALALGGCGEVPPDVERLLRDLESDEAPAVQFAAGEALRKLGR